MQFDSLAHLKSFETPKTTNMFLKDIDSYKTGQSVTTYVYTGHLCTQAVEKIPVEFDGGNETLTCTSSFAYNSHGDLATWTYSGGVYKSKGNNWRVDDMTFTVSYDYVYDEKETGHKLPLHSRLTSMRYLHCVPTIRLSETDLHRIGIVLLLSKRVRLPAWQLSAALITGTMKRLLPWKLQKKTVNLS